MINDYNITGVKSIFIPDVYKFRLLEDVFRFIIQSHNYYEIKLQLLEITELFQKTLGCESDVIKKEMFTFFDKSNKSITLLPEGTTSCTKFLSNFGFLRNNSKIDVWYISSMFRREKPQKGRHRMFNQIGIESYGVKDFYKELEHIMIFKKLLLKFNIKNVLLELNCLPFEFSRNFYKKILLDFFASHVINFEAFINFNPMRILDKNKNIYSVLIPNVVNYLDSKNRKDFFEFLYFLKKLNISFIVNNYLVRGLEYYTNIVYEWTFIIDNKFITLCAGGRYDNLSFKISKIKSYSTGFAFGVERFFYLLESPHKNLDTVVFFKKKSDWSVNFKYLNYIREKYPHKCIAYDINKKFIKKMKHKNPNLEVIFF